KQGVELVNVLKQMQDGKIDKQGLTDEQIATAMKNQLTDISDGKKTFIEANIEPQHRQVVTKALNNYLSDAVKGKNTDASYKKFAEGFDKYHILNNPQELLKEFVRLTKSDDPAKADMAKVYESYMVKGCYELAKFDTAVTMMSEASNGHMHEVAKDFNKITTPKEWDEQGGEHNLSTDEGFQAFLEKSQETCGVDNTLTMLNHIGQNDRAMQLEMKNVGMFDELKSLMSKETLPQIINIVQTKSEFVSGLNLSKAPKEAKMREQYMAKMEEFIQYINENAPKILAKA
ncbi:hypothetical protein IJ707_07830, partial [bacterium]|nr:hypothetical protein [bacterium]